MSLALSWVPQELPRVLLGSLRSCPHPHIQPARTTLTSACRLVSRTFVLSSFSAGGPGHHHPWVCGSPLIGGSAFISAPVRSIRHSELAHVLKHKYHNVTFCLKPLTVSQQSRDRSRLLLMAYKAGVTGGLYLPLRFVSRTHDVPRPLTPTHEGCLQASPSNFAFGDFQSVAR